MRLVPKERWFDFTYVLIDHGRALCTAKKPEVPRVPGRAVVPGQPGVSGRTACEADGGGASRRVGRAAREHDRGVRGRDRRRRGRGRVRRPDDGRRHRRRDARPRRVTDNGRATGLVSEMTLETRSGGSGVPTLEEALRMPRRPRRRRHRDQELCRTSRGSRPTRSRRSRRRSTPWTRSGFPGPGDRLQLQPERRSPTAAPFVPTSRPACSPSFDVDADEALTRATGHGHPWVLPFVTKVLEASDGFADRVHAGRRAPGRVDRRRSRDRAAPLRARRRRRRHERSPRDRPDPRRGRPPRCSAASGCSTGARRGPREASGRWSTRSRRRSRR